MFTPSSEKLKAPPPAPNLETEAAAITLTVPVPMFTYVWGRKEPRVSLGRRLSAVASELRFNYLFIYERNRPEF